MSGAFVSGCIASAGGSEGKAVAVGIAWGIRGSKASPSVSGSATAATTTTAAARARPNLSARRRLSAARARSTRALRAAGPGSALGRPVPVSSANASARTRDSRPTVGASAATAARHSAQVSMCSSKAARSAGESAPIR
ncbi:hypothetical protein ABFC64_12020 [Microbacterium rhizosphaerae]